MALGELVQIDPHPPVALMLLYHVGGAPRETLDLASAAPTPASGP